MIAGRTNSWPQADGEVVSSRTVREDAQIGPYGTIVPLYRGEYQIRYVVHESSYYIWVAAPWADKDRTFVEDKLEAAQHCSYRVRYNPFNPRKALAKCADK